MLCRYCQGRKPSLVDDTVPRWLGLSAQYHASADDLKVGPTFAGTLLPIASSREAGTALR